MALTHGLDRWLVNPIIRTGFRLGVMTRAYALLETTGARTGRRRVVPVANGFVEDDEFWVVVQDGWRCGYLHNLVAHPRVRVRRRWGPWREGRAQVLHHVDGLAKRHELDLRNGVVGRMDGVIFRLVHTDPIAVRSALD